ncbi:MAG: glutamine--tRNA ligase/YqeY domain fusion protein [Planctomycetota bacterium]
MSKPKTDFIRDRIRDDVAAGKNDGRVHTRFPPEPNGYLHIGHAKSIYLNFSVAQEFGGQCNLRFDDTNPTKEEVEYVEAIQEDVRWLGFEWEGEARFASDYFDQLYEWAVQLVRDGKAYVDSLSAEEIRENRGTLTEPGVDSPHRGRSVEENLALLESMRRGEVGEGEAVLRAKIDMAHANLNLRDPVMYRVVKAAHHRTGDKWCIYPMYDWAHGQSDSIEGITHSLCTLEFEHHRPLYDWFLAQIGVHHPQQIEFSRFNLSHTIVSKRKLRQLVEEKRVSGWDDPRMPTLRGLRRRGYTAAAIRALCKHVGITKFTGVTELALLENFVREDLNRCALRRMAVLHPLKVVIDNWPDGQLDELEAINNPEDEAAGKRQVPFGKELYIERDDFMEDPPKKYFRLAPGREVRLRYGYFVTCTDVVKDANGDVVEVHCSYDPETRGGNAPDGRKVKGTIHWVSAAHAVDAEVRLYETLFAEADPGAADDMLAALNPNSLQVLHGCKVEPALGQAEAGTPIQFERLGYFCADTVESRPGAPVFNRTVTLRDSWAKVAKKK